MSLDRLCELFPPPNIPVCPTTLSAWAKVKAELGTDLPEELLRFSTLYGLGTFRGTETTALSIFCPGYSGFVDTIHFNLSIVMRDCRGEHKDERPSF